MPPVPFATALTRMLRLRCSRPARSTCARFEAIRDAEPDVSYRIAPLDFVKLITGVESGPKMFVVFGRLRIRGNLMTAARVQTWFRISTG